MSLDRGDPPELREPVATTEDLAAFFRAAEKPPGDWRVGTEHEKLGLYEADLSPVPHEGSHGIGALLEYIAAEDGWDAIEEGGHTIALQRDRMAVSLEPGGQFELAGAPLATVFETCDEFQTHLALMRRVSESFGIVWLALGIHPFHSLADVPRMPRERHQIMREYLPAKGPLALEMMHMTGTVQASFDWQDEADFVDKFRTSLAVTPIVSAIFANSSISEGKPNGFVSRRVHIWTQTDPERTGLLPFVFEEGFGYEAYARWAASVPMFFVAREGRYTAAGGLPFGRFMAEGFQGEHATVGDFSRHLTTLFPEVRAKNFIEVRGADAVPPSLTCSLPALWKGLLYDREARAGALALARGWSAEERSALLDAVARRGLEAEAADGRPLVDLATDLVDLAEAGLRRLVREGLSPRDESRFLEPIREQLDLGMSPGQVVRERWEGEWARSPERLIEYARY